MASFTAVWLQRRAPDYPNFRVMAGWKSDRMPVVLSAMNPVSMLRELLVALPARDDMPVPEPASTGPRSEERGECHRPACCGAVCRASTGPRSEERGEDLRPMLTAVVETYRGFLSSRAAMSRRGRAGPVRGSGFGVWS